MGHKRSSEMEMQMRQMMDAIRKLQNVHSDVPLQITASSKRKQSSSTKQFKEREVKECNTKYQGPCYAEKKDIVSNLP